VSVAVLWRGLLAWPGQDATPRRRPGKVPESAWRCRNSDLTWLGASLPSSTRLTRLARLPLLRLLARLRPLAGRAALAYGAALASTGLALVVPLALRGVVDAAIGGRPDALSWIPITLDRRGLLIAGALTVVGLGLVRAGFSFVQRYGTAWVGRTVATDFRGDVFNALLRLDVAYHDKASVGQLMTRVTDDTEQVRQFAAVAIPELISILVLTVGSAAILLGIDPLLAAVALGTLPPLVAMAVGGARALRPRFLRVQSLTGGLNARLQESLAQIRVVQAFSAERRTAERYGTDNEELFARRMAVARVFTSVFPAMTLVLSVATAAVLLLGGERVVDGRLTIGTLVAFNSYIALLGQPVRRLGFLLNLSSRASASAERVYRILDRRPAMTDPAQPASLGEVEGRVDVEAVDFSYGDGPQVLDGVDFALRPGEHVALVGRSGAGKTALVELLPRLYDPDRGRVTVDGTDVRDVARSDLQAAVGLVEQTAFLFSTTVAANVAFARPDATRGEVEAACRIAGAHDFVTALPDGYDTVVGERGVTLSGGQRQRLALARALLTRPPVLVLDDAVSAVDATTEARIRASLAAEGAGRSILSVAQRLSTILAADRIVVLESGRVVEQGTHAELLEAGGAYARLFRTAVENAGAA